MVNIKQGEKEYLADFTKYFKNAKDIMETQHGNLTLSKYIENLSVYDGSKKEKNLDSWEAYRKFVAYTFIQRSDHIIVGKLKENLANKFSLGVNSCPYELKNATNMGINYKNYVNNPNYYGKKKKQLNKYLGKESDSQVALTQIFI